MATEQTLPVRRTVYARTAEEWVNENTDTHTDSTVHASREDALRAAEKMIRDGGGGTLTERDRDGAEERKKIVSGHVSIARGSETDAGFKVRSPAAHDEQAMSDPVQDDPAPILKGTNKGRR
jgi:hypothetical protein